MYPHGVHPALVPGVSVDDQRYDYRTDRVVVGVVVGAIASFVAWGLLDTEGLSSASETALDFVTTYFGWFFSLLAAVVLFYMLAIGFSRYGRIPLGLDGEEPEFSTFSWVAMLFAAGMGIGLLFFGPYEPMQYYLEPPPGTVDPETRAAMHRALVQTVFHWGPQAWAMYALVGATVAYGAYRRGRTILMSSIFEPLIGRAGVRGVRGRLIDIFAIIATLFGTAASLGIGALQIGRGLQIVGGLGELGNAVLIGIVMVLTVVFIVSAVSGVAKGIRYLSNTNMTLALLMAFFVFVAGPTLFLVNIIPASIAGYAQDMFGLMAYSASQGEAEAAFLKAWTTFYWAWWVSWSPFVGIFIAKISRGRTLRQFVFVVVLVPSLVCLTSFSIYGGTSMWMQEQGLADVASAPNAQDSLFILLDALPLSSITPVVVIFMLTVFFVTSADSASVVMGSLAQRGRSTPSHPVVIMLGLLLSAIAVVMLLIGRAVGPGRHAEPHHRLGAAVRGRDGRHDDRLHQGPAERPRRHPLPLRPLRDGPRRPRGRTAPRGRLRPRRHQRPPGRGRRSRLRLRLGRGHRVVPAPGRERRPPRLRLRAGPVRRQREGHHPRDPHRPGGPGAGGSAARGGGRRGRHR